MERYEHRPEQLAMAEDVAEAIRTKEHLIVEAGTGVGKSFAYLVPAILAAAADEEGKPRKEWSSRPIRSASRSNSCGRTSPSSAA